MENLNEKFSKSAAKLSIIPLSSKNTSILIQNTRIGEFLLILIFSSWDSNCGSDHHYWSAFSYRYDSNR